MARRLCAISTGSGIEVIVACLQKDQIDKLAADLDIEVHCMDISDAEAVSSVFGGREIDIVVNCAAVLGPMSKLYETPVDIADRLVRVNLVGTLNFIRAMVPGMITRNRGHIVNFGSVAGAYPILGEPFYGATKAGIHLLSQNLRMDLHGTDIRVSEILPGRVESGMHAEMVGGDKELSDREFYAPYDCLQPEDIAQAVNYVLSAPPHVDITHIEIMPTRQVMGGAHFVKNE